MKEDPRPNLGVLGGGARSLVPAEQFPEQGLNLDPLHWECGVLATGPLVINLS